MKQYEYRYIERTVRSNAQSILAKFNELGKQGFKYITETKFEGYTNYVFMKEIEIQDDISDQTI